MNFSDETLGAYVDGELDAAQRTQVEAALAVDPGVARRIERLRAVRNQLLAAFGGVVHEPVPQRLLDAVQKIASSPERTARQRRRYSWSWPELGAIAATLVMATIFGYFFLRQPAADLFMRQQGALLARGALAEALSTQLASEQARDSAVRIGITFRDKRGSYCRTFELQGGDDLAGLACRESESWHVQALAKNEGASGSGGAEVAGSALPAEVLRKVEASIVGEPLDAAGEAAARRSNWRPN